MENHQAGTYKMIKNMTIVTLCRTSAKEWTEFPKQLVEISIPPIIEGMIKAISKDIERSETEVMTMFVTDLILKGLSIVIDKETKESLTKREDETNEFFKRNRQNAKA